jgi:hypothetical protein
LRQKAADYRWWIEKVSTVILISQVGRAGRAGFGPAGSGKKKFRCGIIIDHLDI